MDWCLKGGVDFGRGYHREHDGGWGSRMCRLALSDSPAVGVSAGLNPAWAVVHILPLDPALSYA